MQVTGDLSTIIVDIGSLYIKVGHGSKDTPAIIKRIPTRILNDKTEESLLGLCNFISDCINELDGLLFTKNQIQNYYSLVVSLNSKNLKVKEKLLSFFFGNIKGLPSPFNGIYFGNKNTFDILSFTKTSGIVVSIGATLEVCGINDGIIYKSVTGNNNGFMLIESIKEKYKNEINDYIDNHSHTKLRNELNISLAEECIEAMMEINDYKTYTGKLEIRNKFVIDYDPIYVQTLNDNIVGEIVLLIKEVAESAESERKNIMISNILISGGLSNIKGLGDGIAEKLGLIYPPSKIKISVSTKYSFDTFLGASAFGILGSAKALFISRSDYNKHGKNILAKKTIY